MHCVHAVTALERVNGDCAHILTSLAAQKVVEHALAQGGWAVAHGFKSEFFEDCAHHCDTACDHGPAVGPQPLGIEPFHVTCPDKQALQFGKCVPVENLTLKIQVR